MKSIGFAVAAATLLTAAPAAAAVVLIDTTGTADTFGYYGPVAGAGLYQVEIEASDAVNINSFFVWERRWIVQTAEPGQPRREVDGNEDHVIESLSAYGTRFVQRFKIALAPVRYSPATYDYGGQVEVGDRLRYQETLGFTLLNLSATTGVNGPATDYRIKVTHIAQVPEPSTWALMIGGFGAAGAALRRRRAIA